MRRSDDKADSVCFKDLGCCSTYGTGVELKIGTFLAHGLSHFELLLSVTVFLPLSEGTSAWCCRLTQNSLMGSPCTSRPMLLPVRANLFTATCPQGPFIDASNSGQHCSFDFARVWGNELFCYIMNADT